MNCVGEWLLARSGLSENAKRHAKIRKAKRRKVALDKDFARKTENPKRRQVKNHREKSNSTAKSEKSKSTAKVKKSKSAARRETSKSHQPRKVEQYSGRLQVEKSTSRNVDNDRKRHKSIITLSNSSSMTETSSSDVFA